MRISDWSSDVCSSDLLCIALGVVEIGGISLAFPKLTLVVEFIFMAFVLVFRPWGLLGKPLASVRHAGQADAPLRPSNAAFRWFALLLIAMFAFLPALAGVLPYASVLAQDMLIAVLFAVSPHFMMGLGGMSTFGHGAYFGIGEWQILRMTTSHQ